MIGGISCPLWEGRMDGQMDGLADIWTDWRTDGHTLLLRRLTHRKRSREGALENGIEGENYVEERTTKNEKLFKFKTPKEVKKEMIRGDFKVRLTLILMNEK